MSEYIHGTVLRVNQQNLMVIYLHTSLGYLPTYYIILQDNGIEITYGRIDENYLFSFSGKLVRCDFRNKMPNRQ